MLTQIGYEEPYTDPLKCVACAKPLINFETKLCAEHYTELREVEATKWGEEKV